MLAKIALQEKWCSIRFAILDFESPQIPESAPVARENDVLSIGRPRGVAIFGGRISEPRGLASVHHKINMNAALEGAVIGDELSIRRKPGVPDRIPLEGN